MIYLRSSKRPEANPLRVEFSLRKRLCGSAAVQTHHSNNRDALMVFVALLLCAFPEQKSSAKVADARASILAEQKVEFTASKGIIRSEWIVEAVQKHAKIDITNAIISGDLHLQYAQVEKELVLVDCEFKGSVDFSFATCKRDVIFKNAVFDGTTSFNGIRCEHNFVLDDANFQPGQLDSDGKSPIWIAGFEDLDVKGIFSMSDAHLPNRVRVDFYGAVFEKGAVFRNVVFDDDADFRNSSLAGALDFRGSTFAQGANFFAIQVDGQSRFQGTKFSGVTNFYQAKFSGDVYFNRDSDGEQSVPPAIFAKGVDFGGITCGHVLNLDGVEFRAGEADSEGRLPEQVSSFLGMVVKGNYSMVDAQFGKGVKADFTGTRFDKSAFFNGSNFEGEVVFDGSVISGRADFRGGRFAQGVNFVQILVGGQGRFEGTKFLGVTTFYQATFSGDVYFNQDSGGDQSLPSAEFSKGAWFDGITCGHVLNLDGVEFKAGDADSEGHLPQQVASFVGIVVKGDYSVAGADFGKGVKADFDSASFAKGAIFSGSNFDGEVDFEKSVFGGTADFRGVSFAQGADFSVIRVGGQSLFQGTKFLGDASFYEGRFSGDVRFDRDPDRDPPLASAIFCKRANFYRAICENSLNLDGAVFKAGDADSQGHLPEQVASFVGIVVKGDYSMAGADFGKGVKANFNSASFAKGAIFSGSNFDGEVDFDKSIFGGTGDFRGVTFAQGANFSVIQVGGQSLFQGAKFLGDASFYEGRFSGDVHFDRDPDRDPALASAIFRKGANFRGTSCENSLNLDGVEFKAGDADSQGHLPELAANFFGIVVKGDYSMTGADFGKGVKAAFRGAFFAKDAVATDGNFEGDADFEGSTIGGTADFSGASFAQVANFPAITVNGRSLFQATNFLGPAIFSNSKFTGDVMFDAASFAEDAVFDAIVAKGSILFRPDAGSSQKNVLFGGRTSFNISEIGKDAVFLGAQFRGATFFQKTHIAGVAIFEKAAISEAATFTDLEIEGHCSFANARFEKATDFSGIHINGQLNFQSAVLRDETKFLSAAVKGNATFLSTNFDCPVNFGSAHFLKAANFEKIVFNKYADFTRVVVDGDADFSEATFRQGSSFAGAIIESADFIKGSFYGKNTFNQSHFKGPASFAQCRVSEPFNFASVIADHDLDFSGATFSRGFLFIGSHISGRADFIQAVFDGASVFGFSEVNGGAIFVKTQFGSVVSFEACHFPGVTRFDDATFRNGVNFRESNFDSVQFLGNETAARKDIQFGGDVDLRGCSYNRISVDWRSLIPHIKPFDRQPYAELEKALIGAGQDTSADDVYRARQKAEGSQKWNERDGIGWFTNVAYGFLADYGVHPYTLIYIAVIIIALGTLFFSNPATVCVEKKDSASTPVISHPEMWTWTGAFGLAVHYFLPIAILVGSRWSACDSPVEIKIPRFVHSTRAFRIRPSVVATILQIAGWILVPLGVAALTGLLRIKQ